MNQGNTKIKYFIYARKSTESDERQVQSIDDQISTMTRVARDVGLTILDTLHESKSAKEPYGRVVFEKMLERIEKGEAKGILAWKIDRLSRNPIDSARLQWMLQKEVIQSIQTDGREYKSEDNALILSVESSMANQFIRDLSKNVMRGLKSKMDKGWMPAKAPPGYLNTKTENKGENYIIIDPERFALVRKAWDLMLTGNYLPRQILEKLNNEWGYRSRTTKRMVGGPMGRTTIYDIFSNVFYAGIIPYMKAYTEGKHQSMITLEEFDRVQILLGRKGKPRPSHHKYSYTGEIRCGECGGVVSATFKQKIIKKTNTLKDYYLYYCVHARKGTAPCSQRQYTNAEKLDVQIEKEIEKFTILPEFKDWALAILNEQNDAEIMDRTKIYDAQQKVVNDAQRQLDNLTQLRLREMIDDEEYTKEKTRLKNELTEMRTRMKGTEERAEKWLDLTEQTFKFACYAHKAFMFGDPEVKKEILNAIGVNWKLKDNILKCDTMDWFIPIKEQHSTLTNQKNAFELRKSEDNKGRMEVSGLLNPSIRPYGESNPGLRRERAPS